jgi:hypothetical protein
VGGRVVIVRYADDFVIGFQREADARAMLSELGERLAVFGLTLHEKKTRLIEFGRIAATSRSQRGERRPETFAFLGFTHYCGWTRARQVHRQAQDAEQAPDAQAEGAAQGSMAADARAVGHPAWLVRSRAGRPLRLLRTPPDYRALASFRRPVSAATSDASGSRASGAAARRAGRCGGTSSMP